VKKILFRADAKPSLGTGDLVSLANLSGYFEKAGWQAHFMVKDHETAAAILVGRGARNYLALDKAVSIKEEVGRMNGYIDHNGIDAVILEITERKTADYGGMTNKVIKGCVIFDGAVPEWADLVINWDVGALSVIDAAKYPSTKFLLGIRYVILPLGFDFGRINRRKYKKRPESVLVAMGGADEFDFTKKVVDSLVRNKAALKLRVVTGSGYRYRDSLEKSLSAYRGEHTLGHDVDDMFAEYMDCDIAIGAGGLTAFELMATRTPSLLVAAYEHQKARCEYFDDMGWATYLGFKDFDEGALLAGLARKNRIPPEVVYGTDDIRKAVDELLERR